MKETRESGDILNSIKALTIQHMALTNEIMRLKRELAGRPAVSARGRIIDGKGEDDNNDENVNTTNNLNTTTAPTTTKKRGRGRPRKDSETVSSLAPTYDEVVDRTIVDTGDIINNDSKTMRYVLEGGELFLHNTDNGRLFDIEMRTIVGRYNLYLDRIDWV